ncbi:cactin [Artemisia annua]|uniref:Cactin n=1 Tax=Artemisia annua TaxID=35608 RepID=A0A2U1M8J8_ARTAN|nr:cactin [Artemisia annua]
MIEFEKLEKRREERAIKKRKHDEEMELLARERARAEYDQWEQKLEEFHSKQAKYRTNIIESHEENMNIDSLSPLYNECSDFGVRKPKHINRVHTGYNWNGYNRIHYDKEHPPPNMVTGYKFDVFYPDLIDGDKPPSYTIEKDGDGVETCIIRFHGGPPYQDIAFKIVNNEWELSRKKGFKCVFEQGVLRLYFNFKSLRYRR